MLGRVRAPSTVPRAEGFLAAAASYKTIHRFNWKQGGALSAGLWQDPEITPCTWYLIFAAVSYEMWPVRSPRALPRSVFR